jgi:hypothetical protein
MPPETWRFLSQGGKWGLSDELRHHQSQWFHRKSESRLKKQHPPLPANIRQATAKLTVEQSKLQLEESKQSLHQKPGSTPQRNNTTAPQRSATKEKAVQRNNTTGMLPQRNSNHTKAELPLPQRQLSFADPTKERRISFEETEREAGGKEGGVGLETQRSNFSNFSGLSENLSLVRDSSLKTCGENRGEQVAKEADEVEVKDISEVGNNPMVFEHKAGCAVCKGLFEHYQMPDGRIVHLFAKPKEKVEQGEQNEIATLRPHGEPLSLCQVLL